MGKKQIFGLTSQEAVENKKIFGDNSLSQKKTLSFWAMLIDSFKDKWILILIGALGVQILFNILSTFIPGLGHPQWYEAISIIVAILLSTGFATLSSYSNEKKFVALQAEAGKIIVKAYRDGKVVELGIGELTIGDAVLLQSGDLVPFDGTLVSGKIKVNQASLNGESEDAKKKVYEGKDEDLKTDNLFSEYMVFRGSVVTEGKGVIVAKQIGDNTILGSINTSLQENLKPSPSTIKLDKLANQIGKMGYTVAGLYFVMKLATGIIAMKGNYVPVEVFLLFMRTLIYSVTIVIMAVPEGLPMMLAMVAGMNSQRLLKENILVRNPDSIETAGYTSALFSDKTGTITKGVLSVVDFILGDGKEIKKPENSVLKDYIVNATGLNNEAVITSEKVAAGSNGTDRALMTYIIENGHEKAFDVSQIVERKAFTSATKFASITLKDGTVYTKGAAEVIQKRCTHYIDENGKIQELHPEKQALLDKISVERAKKCMRLLGLSVNKEGKEIFIAFASIRDDLREGMVETVKSLREAGIHVVMVTGDRLETAKAIASDAGIMTDEDMAITHDELDAMDDNTLKQNINKIKVVSRALPMDKKRLVNVLQTESGVAGMTGDGTNDAPALKTSDIGYSMGDGSEVAKEASDVVILNNSLTSIEKAVLFGRTMTKSVQKFIIFQLAVNVSVIAISLLSPIFNWNEPFTIVQILWINLIMDTLAALAFGEEPPLEEYMKEKPAGKYEDILTGYMKSQIGLAGTFITLTSLGLFTNFMGMRDFFIGNTQEDIVRTFIFTFFVYTVIFNGLNTRSTHFNVLKNISLNKKFIYVMGSIAIVQSLLIQFGGKVFSTVPMDLKHFFMALALSAVIIPLDILRKWIINLKNKK